MDSCRIRPMVDQIKIAPGRWNEDTVNFCQYNGIVPMAWGPLSFDTDRKPLQAIGDRYGKSWAQVVLRRDFQRGIVTIPKSHSFQHQKDNLEIFDFELTEEEIEEIRQI